MTATFRFRILARTAVREVAMSGFARVNARMRDVKKDSGDEWKANVSERPCSVLGLPYGSCAGGFGSVDDDVCVDRAAVAILNLLQV